MQRRSIIMAPRALTDDLVEEILLRFPPDQPELLVRAALLSKRWYRLISGPRFRRRFRELHRTPPMLGFFYLPGDGVYTHFAATTSVGPLPHTVCAPIDRRATDSRHGLVVLYSAHWRVDYEDVSLELWDPVTDARMHLPKPPTPPGHVVFPESCHWTAAAVSSNTAAGGDCSNNDVDCDCRSFLVVFLCTGSTETFTCVYSSDSDSWSVPKSVQLHHSLVEMGAPSVLVGTALYYVGCSHDDQSRGVIKYDLLNQETSLIELPLTPYTNIVLTAMKDYNRLGFAAWHEDKLYLWLREPGLMANAGWRQTRVLKLCRLFRSIRILPDYLHLLSLVDGVTAVFWGSNGSFIINLVTGRIVMLRETQWIFNLVPYTSFYTPALRVAVTDETEASSSTA